MGIQTMGSAPAGGGGGGGVGQFLRNLGKQSSSPYTLTMNEVQSQLGEPLRGMNIDELLRSVLPPPEEEGGQPFTIDLEGSSWRATTEEGGRKRTVDEVWRDIQRRGQNRGGGACRSAQGGHPALGEMTLEEFLAKAGVVVAAEGFPNRSQRRRQRREEPNRIGIYASSHGASQIPVDAGMGNILHSSAYTENRNNGGVASEAHTRGRNWLEPEGLLVENTVDRRQKRMIKNRESAARSRARKQAYTNELENRISRLEQENESLKKQKKLDRLLYTQPAKPNSQLRRTSSASF